MSEIIPLAEVAAIAPSGQFVSYPGSPFELYQPYPPAGDQPVAIEQLVEGVHDGEVFQTLLGVTGSGKTFTMANVIAQLGRPAIVFAPNKTLAAQLYSEFREFFPKNAVEYFVSYYDYYQPEAYVPQRDLFIEKDSAINEHIEQMRLSCTKSIMERRDVVIVATVSAIYGIGEPESYHRMIMTLRTGDKLGQRDVIAQLIRMQYQRNDMEFSRGKFRVRGDTIDVFPAEHSELAIRIELFDDEIESLQLFDPLTGRIRQKIPRFTVYPSSHYVTPRDKVLAAVETIKVELAQRLKELVGMGKLVEAQRLEQRTRFDLEMLSEVGHCKGIENYSRHLSGAAPGEAGASGRPTTVLTARISALSIRAPVTGRVLGLAVTTLQAVIRAGDPVLYLIPQDRPLVISARIAPIHIDEVSLGQSAELVFPGFAARDTGIAAGTKGVANIQVAKFDGGTPPATMHDTDIHFTFVLEGTMTLKAKGEPDRTLSAGDAFVLPPGLAAQYSDCSADLELLEATLPAGFTTTVTSL